MWVRVCTDADIKHVTKKNVAITFTQDSSVQWHGADVGIFCDCRGHGGTCTNTDAFRTGGDWRLTSASVYTNPLHCDLLIYP